MDFTSNRWAGIAYRRRITSVFGFGLAVLLAACGGLSGEPQIIVTLPPQPTVIQDVGYPLQPPDIARGVQIYAENCTRCHGVSGASDGELVKSGEVLPMPALTDPATARDQTPQDFFRTITEGRLDKLMPPWNEKLSEADRWAVALYTYTLAYMPDQLARGKQLWQGNCQECHGASGRGDGPKAAEINRPIGNLTEQTEITTLSDKALFSIVSEGVGENMPAFADTLTEDERYATIAYARTFTVANGENAPVQVAQDAQGAQPATTSEANEPEVTSEANVLGTVSGRVTNGTAASAVPPDLQVSLGVSNQGTLVKRDQQTIAADGSYTFTDVPMITGADYVVVTVYRERVFSSDFVTGDSTKTAMDLPLTIYELTEDPAVISMAAMVSQVSAVGDTLEVRQVMRFTNNSDRVFTSGNDLGNNHFASLIVALPPGAQIVSFDQDGRYSVSEKDFSFVDTAPVYPKEDHLVIVVYILPYDGGASLIEQPLNYPLDGQMRLLMYPQELNVSSEQLPRIGPQPVGDKTYEGYGATLQLKTGDVIRYEVSGTAAPGAQITGTTSTVATTNLLPILLLIIGGAVALIGLILFFRARGAPAPVNKQRLIDALVQQIAELDSAHSSGQLNHDLWHRQRAQLKARLAELLGEENEE
jgi:mono/diheme cytochrome c family protein